MDPKGVLEVRSGPEKEPPRRTLKILFGGVAEMLSRWRGSLTRFCRQRQGSSAVEFAIILPVFLLLTFGIVDFGHAWYMKQLMVNASREGARYGTRYQTDTSGNRVLPTSLNIQDYVKNTWGLSSMLPADSNPNVTLGGAAATETNVANLTGEDLTVTVTARKNWLVIGKLVPGLASYIDISTKTDMKCE